MAIALSSTSVRRMLIAAYVLIVLSVGIHVVGVFGETNQWSRCHNIGGTTAQANASMDATMFDVHDSQIITHLRHLLHLE